MAHNYLSLKNFISIKMQMSHIFQPVVIRTLLQNSGQASVRKLAEELVRYDISQIEYYEDRVKKMPIPVLERHGIIQKIAGEIYLAVEDLTDTQKQELIELCTQKTVDYIKSRGDGLWDYRMNDGKLVSGSLRFQVLERAGHKCELCGISSSERALDIDHIRPSSLGGDNTIFNLQALCFKCNRAKGNKSSRNYGAEKSGKVAVYEKLVRDKIPEIIAKEGKVPTTRSLKKAELLPALKAKLFEEVQEFNRAEKTKDALAELADLLQLVETCAKTLGKDIEHIETLRLLKLRKHGGFQKMIFLERVELNPQSESE